MLALSIDQLRKVARAHEPRRFLTAKPKGATGQDFRRRTPPRLLGTHSEIFRRNLIQRDMCFSEFCEQPKVRAVHVVASGQQSGSLLRANEILRTASAYFAQAELDRRRK